jgi:uncharacterized damage-inducible protein DinB
VSRFTNPAGSAREAAADYINALLELLGDRDPYEVWEESPAEVARLTQGISDTDARREEREGKWSVAQIVQHLVDTELVYGYRMRMIVAHDQPDITGYDQDLWATRLRYNEEPLSVGLEDLRVFRERNLRFVRRLGKHELDRWGQHTERGRESIRHLIRTIAAHDLLHRAQLSRVISTLGLRG